ncbi:hypothetical protein BGX27_007169, partial [Mortierella sp. AM989]
HCDALPPVAGAIAGYEGPVKAVMKNADLSVRDDCVLELQNMCGFADDPLSTTVWEANVFAALLSNAQTADLWYALGLGLGTILPVLFDVQPSLAQVWGSVGELVGSWALFHYQWRAGGADVSASTHDFIVSQELRHSVAVRGIEMSVAHKSSWAKCDFGLACLARTFDS